MKAYVSTERDDGKVEIDGTAAIYRDPERGHAIVVESGGRDVALDVADATVSRRSDGDAPIVVELADSRVEVRNNGNANGLTVTSGGQTESVPEDRVATVDRDATLSIGARASIELVVERTAGVTNVYHEGSGDVVAGDVTTVDRSTTITDSVVNRSDVGSSGADGADGGSTADAAGGETTVEDSVVNRSDVGGSNADAADGRASDLTDERMADPTDERPQNPENDDGARTQRICDEHGPYAPPECPECERSAASDAGGRSDGSTSGRSADSSSGDADAASGGEDAASGGTDEASDGDDEATQFCIFCGEGIPAGAAFCPECGEELP
ncbi:hypothetical protein ACFQDG_17085 [Natronoarchaeum mannanilyticum]|uniref:Zinc-ribbon domain-containing protein n=1 Tax=Natronoarchaeum mannanilyticum TaxID=926360 RepID=A0AAV3T9P7_9EURY